MAPNPKSDPVALQAFKILRALYQLSTDLHASKGRQELIFRILNGTIHLFPYRRAVLWSLKGKRPVLLGVSGREEVNRNAPLAELWQPLAASLKEIKGVHVVKQVPRSIESQWRELADKTSGLSLMWVPIVFDGNVEAGLWLERWGLDEWEDSESDVMRSYAQNLCSAWRRFEGGRRWQGWRSYRPKKMTMSLVACVLLLAAVVPVMPLRVVAPCEVAPRDPEMIASPLDGVIKEILVKPGDRVKADEPLFIYEDRVILQELEVAQKQVEIIKSQYDRMRFKSFMDPDAMEEIQILKFRLEQEEVRLKLARDKTAHLRVRAQSDGVCMIEHPETWRGRPVQVGQRMAMIFQPDQSKINIFLPEKDNIEFDPHRPAAVMLNTAPAKRHAAQLNFVAPQTSRGPQGEIYFLAEANWVRANPPVKVGSKGTAVIYGERVSLGYFLLRKPVASVRRFVGL